MAGRSESGPVCSQVARDFAIPARSDRVSVTLQAELIPATHVVLCNVVVYYSGRHCAWR